MIFLENQNCIKLFYLITDVYGVKIDFPKGMMITEDILRATLKKIQQSNGDKIGYIGVCHI